MFDDEMVAKIDELNERLAAMYRKNGFGQDYIDEHKLTIREIVIIASMIEKETGHISFAILYFLSGIGGNLVSLLNKIMSNDWSMSIGASGAVFGLDGVLLAMVLFSGRKMSTVTPTRVVLMIVLSLYNGFTGAYIDNAAHIGGLITGFLVGTIVCVLQRRRIESTYNHCNNDL